MHSRKLWLTIAGLTALVAIGTGFFVSGLKFGGHDMGLWGLWFAAFDGLVVNYAVANVQQKKNG